MAFGRKKDVYEENGNKVTLITKSSGKKIKKTVSPDGNFKQRQVIRKYDDVNDTGGTVKKTVTRTPGGVEKEIERGNKRIEVRKYKDEGVKTRTVTNMKKNNQYNDNFVAKNAKAIKSALENIDRFDIGGSNVDFASNLKSSTFKNIPKQMFDNANSSQNTQINGDISKSKPLTTPQKKLINNVVESAVFAVEKNMSTDGGFKTTPKTGKITKNK